MSFAAVLSLLRNPWILLVIACVAGAAATGWYRMRWENCTAARAADLVKAERAKASALEYARIKSDEIITAQAAALAETAARVGGITERIIHVPVTTACAQSPAMRAATDGLRELFHPGGGQAPAGGNAPPAVRGSGAGRP
jgi:hypothetical protein